MFHGRYVDVKSLTGTRSINGLVFLSMVYTVGMAKIYLKDPGGEGTDNNW